MIHYIRMLIENINDWNTPLGKLGLTLDGVGVMLSVGFYGLGLGEAINQAAPPIVLILTIMSISTSIFFKIASEYRAWKKRNGKH